MANFYSFFEAFKASENGDDGPLNELTARIVADINRPDIIGPVRPMREDEDVRAYVEATMPSEEHLRQRCRFLGIP